MVCSSPNNIGINSSNSSSSNRRSSSSSSSSSSSIYVDSTRKNNIDSICNPYSSSRSLCALLNNCNIYVRLGASVLVLRLPALLSGCESPAAVSKISVWVTWLDELSERWTGCTLKSGWSNILLP